MDLATIIGLIVGFGAVLGSLVTEGGKIADLVNPAAFMLVIGGTLGATIVTSSLKNLLGLPAVIKKAFICKDMNLAEIITLMLEFARKARRDGILALESQVRDLDNKFLQMGMQLVVDGTPSEMVREILETEVVSLQERHKGGEAIFNTMGGLSPTLGVIGTVMGLIHMLSTLNEPGKMGPAIASAFIATLYGVSFANLVFLPIGTKLKVRTTEEIIAYDMIIEGILSIQAGDNPRMVEQKMKAFLPPKDRAAVGSEVVRKV